MSARSHSPARHRGRRGKGRAGRNAESLSQKVGIGKGLPRYLAKPKPSEADLSSSSEKEAQSDCKGGVNETPVATPLGQAAALAMTRAPRDGRALDEGERGQIEARLREDFSDVRVTENSALADAFGANAMTFGNAIHVAPGRGLSADLLGHELTHVAQQRRFGASGAQFDINETVSEDSGMGFLELGLQSASGLDGRGWGIRSTIHFAPHVSAPYSNAIGLVQAANKHWLRPNGQDDVRSERERQVSTTDGTFIEAHHSELSPGESVEPWTWSGYESARQRDGSPSQENRERSYALGWNRSEQDSGPLRANTRHILRSPGDDGAGVRYHIESVVIGRDNSTVYGRVDWGFDTDGRDETDNEWYDFHPVDDYAAGAIPLSSEFEEALDRFRDFYSHEPIILYFGFNRDVATRAELTKLAGVLEYMSANPGARITLTGSADMQGGEGSENRTLALARIDSVRLRLIEIGVPAQRIGIDDVGAGASRSEGSPDANHRDTEGSYQANRRVTVTFANFRSSTP